MSAGRPDRARVWQLLGEPSDQIGSVNEPRIGEDAGLCWNEKWIYRVEGGPRNGQPERIVLWHRYDFVGLFRVGDDGGLAAEALPGADGGAGEEGAGA